MEPRFRSICRPAIGWPSMHNIKTGVAVVRRLFVFTVFPVRSTPNVALSSGL